MFATLDEMSVLVIYKNELCSRVLDDVLDNLRGETGAAHDFEVRQGREQTRAKYLG